MNFIEAKNIQYFLAVNAPENYNHTVAQIAKVCADDLIYLVPLLLVVLWLWGSINDRKIALQAVATALIALGLAQILGMIFPHPRPFMAGIGHTLITHVADSSFPSDHITFFSAIALTMLVMGKRAIGLLVCALGVVVAWSRLYLGVHFPLDMVGAAVLSTVVFFVLLPFWKMFGHGIYRLFEPIYTRLFAFPIRKHWVNP